MLLQIPDILSATELRQANDLLATAVWTDGRTTAGPQAASVKRNERRYFAVRSRADGYLLLDLRRPER